MTVLRQKIEYELDSLDNQSMAAAYEHIRLLNRIRRPVQKRRVVSPGINLIHDLTSTSKSNWSDAISADREERL